MFFRLCAGYTESDDLAEWTCNVCFENAWLNCNLGYIN